MGSNTKQKASVYLIYGTEDGLVNKRAYEIFSTLTKGLNEFSYEIIETFCADSVEATEKLKNIRESLLTPSLMMTEPKVVWMKNTNLFGDSVVAKTQATEEALGSFKNMLESGLPKNVFLVISASELDKRKSLSKMLLGAAKSEEFNKPDITKSGWQGALVPLVNSEAAARGLKFAPDALNLFVHRVSESSIQIISEIEKMDIYLGPDKRTVTKDVVQDMVPLTRTGVIFEISQALESKKTDRAIKLIDFQMEKGENAITIIRSCFIPTIRRLLLAKLLNEQFSLSRFNYKELNAKLLVLPPDLKALTTAKNGTPQTFAIFNALKWAASFKKDRLKLILKECMKADKSLVSTSENPQMILHRLAIIMAF